MTPRQCEIAAESYTAYLLARCGYDVLVQYGANQPQYDLVAVKGKRIRTISVKGSQDGGWMIAVKYVKEGVNYHTAIDMWLQAQREDLIYVFVQFLRVELAGVPRVYAAVPSEVAAHMRTQRDGQGHGSLQEDWRRDHPRSKYDYKLPVGWAFTPDRIDVL